MVVICIDFVCIQRFDIFEPTYDKKCVKFHCCFKALLENENSVALKFESGSRRSEVFKIQSTCKTEILKMKRLRTKRLKAYGQFFCSSKQESGFPFFFAYSLIF